LENALLCSPKVGGRGVSADRAQKCVPGGENSKKRI